MNKKLSTREKNRYRTGLAMVLPAIIILSVTFLVPLIYSLVLSFASNNSIIKGDLNFVGLKNYINVLKNSRFQAAFQHTCFFVVTTITIEFAIGFAVALLLNREVLGNKAFKAIVAIPLMVAPIVAGLLWRWLFADQYGLVNYLLSFIGVEAPLWFASANASWVAIIIANLWVATPFVILVLLAGLGSLSEEINEAARIDGANAWNMFIKITLPQLKPTILTILIIRLTDAFRIYDLIYILTGGGPGGRTEVLSTYIYKQIFVELKFGQGSAASFMVMLLICSISLLLNRLFNRNEE